MTNYIKRFLYVDIAETERVNALFYPFLFATFVYGLGFFLAGGWSGVYTSSLFQAFNALHTWLPQVWGFAAMMAASSALTLLLSRTGAWGELASMFGVMVWLFAAIVYGINGFWLVLLTVALPNLYFWVMYYIQVKSYERRKAAGLLIDAG